MGILLEKMTPGGKVGHRAFAAVVRGNDDGMKRRPVALGQAISGFRLLSTGSGSRGKKKGRLPDGSGPQRDRTRPRPYAVRGAPSGLLLQVSPRSSRALWSNNGRQHHADGPRQGKHSKKSYLPEILRPWPRWPRPGHDDVKTAWCSTDTSRPQSRRRQGRGTVAAGQGELSGNPG